MSELIVLLFVSLATIAFLSYRLLSASRSLSRIKQEFSEKEASLTAELDKQYETNAKLTDAEKNALRDSITGLPSRQLFEDRFNQTISQCKRYNMMFAILMLELDEFEVIKNALGIEASENLFKEVAARLHAGIRQIDTITRLPSGEFVIILTQIAKAETCAYTARRLLDTIAQPFTIQNKELFVTASIGIALYPMDGDSTTLLLKNADSALYQAAARGCNSYQFFREDMHASSQRMLIIRSSLHSETAYQEFRIYYQPQINIDTQTVVCMDSVLHWEHPDLGVIPEKEIFQVAETNDTIIAIGEWMLRQVSQQMNQWVAFSSAPLTIGVRVSSRQLEHPHFVNKVFEVLQEAKIDPSTLLLQFPESVFINSPDKVEKALHKLKHIGVQIGVNEFGTGNLALKNLRRFPVDFLKISPALIRDITFNKESEAIVNMIIALAKSLNRRVVAEGVETMHQKEILKVMGCVCMQGNYFSHPMLPKEFSERAERGIVEIVE